ncbi:hypothetical protein WR25_01244 [Diploscapter pachys]|uniref:Lipid-binding serum glycoprotein C-terminal domain-containing protein n=1 Tax=Diploscapter pachys TaxID=2018661 RepID=A0A2A2JXH2_9BILA|nr:hypothetical protein WR25_01244 [Diploscapter pachys]
MRSLSGQLISSLLVTSLIALVSSNTAGIYIRLNQKSVDYISKLAEDAFPELLNDLHPADVDGGAAKVSSIHIRNVSRPSIRATFLHGKGISANIKLPTLRTSAHAVVSVVIFSYEGDFIADVSNLTINAHLYFKQDRTINATVVSAPVCNVTHKDLILTFDKDSELLAIKDTIEKEITENLKFVICNMTVDTIQFMLEENQRAQEKFEPPVDDPTAFNAAELGHSLCKPKKIDKIEDEDEFPEPPKGEYTGGPVYWGVDVNLDYPPVFTKDDVVFGINGGITINGKRAQNVTKPNVLNITVLDRNMVGIIVSDYVPNTFFHQVFTHNLTKISEREPKLEIHQTFGARVALAANVSVQFQGWKSLRDVIHLNTKLHLTIKPTVRQSSVYGDVSLTSVDVNVFRIGLSGPFATPIEKVTSFVVPKVLWPQVKKRLRFALNKRGVKLPVFCGVDLHHMQLDYIPHGVALNADFDYDMPLFISTFKRYLNYKAKTNPTLPRYARL